MRPLAVVPFLVSPAGKGIERNPRRSADFLGIEKPPHLLADLFRYPEFGDGCLRINTDSPNNTEGLLRSSPIFFLHWRRKDEMGKQPVAPEGKTIVILGDPDRRPAQICHDCPPVIGAQIKDEVEALTL